MITGLGWLWLPRICVILCDRSVVMIEGHWLLPYITQYQVLIPSLLALHCWRYRRPFKNTSCAPRAVLTYLAVNINTQLINTNIINISKQTDYFCHHIQPPPQVWLVWLWKVMIWFYIKFYLWEGTTIILTQIYQIPVISILVYFTLCSPELSKDARKFSYLSIYDISLQTGTMRARSPKHCYDDSHNAIM